MLSEFIIIELKCAKIQDDFKLQQLYVKEISNIIFFLNN